MAETSENTQFEYKVDLESIKQLCRCCLMTDKRMYNIVHVTGYFKELIGIEVAEWDSLPQWLCFECHALLHKYSKFRRKVLQAHTVLYDYLHRCAPFSIDAQDPELVKYAAPLLQRTNILVVDIDIKNKSGFCQLQHEKNFNQSELDSVQIPEAVLKEENVKQEEPGFSDYEDNITLEEFRSVVSNKDPAELTELLPEDLLGDNHFALDVTKKKKSKRKNKHEKDKTRVKRRKEQVPSEEEIKLPTRSIRKPLEVDPNKIRVIMLNPDEQIKHKEEESKAGLKFPFQCKLCFKGFNFHTKLENHMTKHSPSRGRHKCTLCQMYLPTMYSYNVHMLIHTRRYECVVCQRRMIDRQSIVDHYRSQHEGVTTVYTCDICGKQSNNNKTHRGHMRNHHGGERAKCERCGKSFVNRDSLIEHAQIHEGIKNYECSICNKKFRTRTQIKHHQLKHTNVKQYYCVECDVRFKSAHSLRQHLLKSLKHKDTQSLVHKCVECPKQFDSPETLQHHINIQHLGIRAYRCPQCPANLATKNSLNKHVLSVHKGQRPAPSHVCDTCGKAFTGKSTLVNHVRTHTGEKPFECGACGRKFSQRTALRTHTRLVHLKLPRGKIKPELLAELPEQKLLVFSKQETVNVSTGPPLVIEAAPWLRAPPGPQPNDLYFVTAGP